MKLTRKMTLIGGGSYAWTDILFTTFIDNDFFGKETELCLYDINEKSLNNVYSYCQAYNEKYADKAITLTKTLDEDQALDGADYVIIAISHGGLQPELEDHYIARRHGFYNIKGSESGIAGASRTVRNVPEFIRIARKMNLLCPGAKLLNVTNPLTALTRCVHKYADVEAIGFCHGVVDCVKVLRPLLGVTDYNDISFSVTGLDHCSYLTDIRVRGEDALEILRNKGVIEDAWAGKSIVELEDKFAGMDDNRLRFIIWDILGCLPSITDDHCAEFFYQITGTKENREFFNMHYDRIEERKKIIDNATGRIMKWLDKNEVPSYYVGREVLHKAVEAFEGGRKFYDVINYRNKGQVPELPMDTVVETFANIDATGVHPSIASPMPKAVEAVVRSTALREEMFMEAAVEWDVNKLTSALAIDPLVQDFRQVRQIAREILDYNAQFLPKGWV